MMKMKIGSLFDGSGGFPLAGVIQGGIPVWRSEVEPYPIAVTKSRFPNMVHLGDVSKVKGDEVEPVDIITFGSPCQDLSVAGKRAGLKHEENGDEETTRSGLFMEAIRIIKEMRKATNGLYPTFAIWENVPGAFSSNKGEDFRVVLEEFVKISEPSAKVPPIGKGGWPYADTIVGDGWSIAYRTFDAQYWGVPQRRRRIYLVADFRGERAAEILFEREGLRGYFEKGRTPWKSIATDTERSTGADDSQRIVYCLQGNGIDRADTAGCNGKGWREDASYTLNTIDRPKVVYALDQQGGNKANPQPGDPCHTLGTDSRNYLVCLETFYCNVEDNKSPILKARDYKDPHVVCYWDGGQVTGTLTANNAGGTQRMPDKENFTCVIQSEHVAYGLDRASFNQGENAQFNLSAQLEGDSYQSIVGSLCARDYKGVGTQYVNEDKLVTEKKGRYIVRRLTPTECARLQGFPDKWGHPDKKDSLTDEEYLFWLDVRNTHARINGKTEKQYSPENMLKWYNKLHTDSSEYKMWGNGIALPNALYVMQGIAKRLAVLGEQG